MAPTGREPQVEPGGEDADQPGGQDIVRPPNTCA